MGYIPEGGGLGYVPEGGAELEEDALLDANDPRGNRALRDEVRHSTIYMYVYIYIYVCTHIYIYIYI